jgi:alpha-L-fucosidase 2
MKKILIILLTVCVSQVFEICLAQEGNRLKLWYEKPASVWEEALPIGNGRLGAMVFVGL